MIKKKNNFLNITIIILLILLAFTGYQLYLKFGSNDLSYYSNLLGMNSNGSLISDFANLEDSKLTGDEYSFDSRFCPYYNNLNEKEKKLYRQVYANLINFKTTFVPVINTNKDTIDKVIESVLDDHPEIFWMGESYSYKYTSDDICRQIILRFNSLEKKYSYYKDLIDSEADIIIQKANTKKNDYDKELLVHDELIKKLSYNKAAPYNQTIYSALVNNSTVCAGYAKTFQYIMTKLNIPTYYVTGKSNNEDHAWNIVKLDEYYNVDVTWDDNSSSDYQFFNKTDSNFSTTHERSIISSYLPECNTGVYTYQNKEPKINNIIIRREPRNEYKKYEEIIKDDIEKSTSEYEELERQDSVEDIKEIINESFETNDNYEKIFEQENDVESKQDETNITDDENDNIIKNERDI